MIVPRSTIGLPRIFPFSEDSVGKALNAVEPKYPAEHDLSFDDNTCQYGYGNKICTGQNFVRVPNCEAEVLEHKSTTKLKHA